MNDFPRNDFQTEALRVFVTRVSSVMIESCLSRNISDTLISMLSQSVFVHKIGKEGTKEEMIICWVASNLRQKQPRRRTIK